MALRVVLENLPRADRQDRLRTYDGEVQVVADGSGSASPPVVYTHPVVLAPNDRKVVWIYSRFPVSQTRARVVFRTDREEIAFAETDLRPLAPAESLVGVLRTAGEQLTVPSLSRDAQTHVISVDADQMPPSWQGLSPCDMIIIPRVTERLLTDQREAALDRYVVLGGNILALTGRWTSSYQGTEIAKLLPAELSAPTAYRLGPDDTLQPTDAAGTETTGSDALLLAGVRLRPDARVVVETSGIPLLLSRRHGNGEILLWTGDWNNLLFSKANLPRLISGYLATRTSLTVVQNQINDRFLYFDYMGLLGGGAASALPSPRLIFYILLGYFLLLGPLNFVVLWRLKRLEWAWVTMPLVVVLFGGGLLIAGQVLRGGQVIHRSFEFVSTVSGEERGRSDLLSLHFSASQGKTSLPKPADGTAQAPHVVWDRGDESVRLSRLIPSSGMSVGSGSTLGTEFTVSSEDGQTWLRDMPLRQWDSVFIRTEQAIELGGSVEVRLKAEDRTLKVEILNGTDRALQNPMIIIGNRAWPVGDSVEAGGRIEVEKVFNEPQELVGQSAGFNPMRRVRSGSPTSRDAASEALRSCLVEPNYVNTGPFVSEAILVARLSRAYQKSSPPTVPTEESQQSFLLVQAQLNLTGPVVSQQWFGPRLLSEGLVNYGAVQGGLEQVALRSGQPIIVAMRGFPGKDSDSPAPTLAHLRVPMIVPQQSENTAPSVEVLDMATGRWTLLHAEVANRPIPITARRPDISGFIPSNNQQDCLVSIPTNFAHPVTGGTILRLESNRQALIAGPFLRLSDPRQSPDTKSDTVQSPTMNSDSDF
jgi:hypothetical protein